ncbi:Protein of unknown function DUF3468 [Penicillium cf. griseofulvum]|uniref:Uncharacterized protein n=1 Tax=Penicillium cf. griseofulvum TaxID=2972120 RepID=A0A9W9M5F5_9EURO|nr:Protein of unknown function DUF3468 [Penicillium cf. griseofulvum]KAJ5427577.1 Protein of unknown function DUF3468 [Penicillium cf. griseofulvum]KAJ5431774.1 Protein of unknown function DUF3468 [Penicillium cf. griseofulvum]
MCNRAGRVCQGYAAPPDRRTREVRDARTAKTNGGALNIVHVCQQQAQSAGLIHMVDSSQIGLSRMERDYLYSFRSYTASQCAGYNFDPFWHVLVHQVCESCPEVRHAAIGIGALHRRFANPTSDRNDIFPIRQSTKAISCLRTAMMKDDQSDPSATEKVLVACIVLVTFALFQGDVDAVRCHLQAGTKLLWEWRKKNSKSQVASVLLHTFIQLHIHWASATRLQDYKGTDYPHLLELIHDNLVDISTHADELSKATLLVSVQAWSLMLSDPVSFDPTTSNLSQGFTWDTPANKIHRFNTQVQQCIVLHQKTVCPTKLRAFTVLQMQIQMMGIVLTSTTFTGSETEWDILLPNFQAIADNAGVLLSSFDQLPHPLFSVKEGFLGTLMFCGLKCRDWTVRQKVLAICRKYNRREGMFSTAEAALLLQRVYDVESSGIPAGEYIPESARLTAVFIAEHPNHSKFQSQSHIKYRDKDGNWYSEWVSP